MAQIFLALVALVFGLAGACFVLIGGSDMANRSPGGGFDSFLLVGLGLLCVAGLSIWGIIVLVKRGKR